MLGVLSLTTVALGAGVDATSILAAVAGFFTFALVGAVALRADAVERVLEVLPAVVDGFTRVDVPVLRRVLIMASIVAL
ncbi:hypothetical protein [Roseovarius sp. MMSF_3281]|uniref:hypothetical protein n=1 Tax=Roseovarius sp. MMSF_3281 TaxID=3046694 RepID=UPI00273F4417|nr:hypothetical protein [Roseovarius sp. MMSF_3281]